ncbi:MAG: GAF domain-containing protein [Deltaproteobacteria bacterium]|nr:MAG: GAF domain-containing protein [Deltaproteobacteria bacterium]
MNFTVTANDGMTVKVDAPNWMMALGKAMAFFEYDPKAMGRWVCVPSASGDIHVDDPVKHQSWTVKPEQEIKIVVRQSNMVIEEEPEEERVDDNDDSEVDFSADVSAIAMPTSALADVKEWEPEKVFSEESLAERLFDLSFDMMGVGPEEACALAVDLVNEFITTETTVAYRASLNDEAMHVGAVTGSLEGVLEGKVVPFGEGLAGTCFDMGTPIEVRNSEEDPATLFGIDEDVDIEPRRVICVPVQNEKGIFGVIQIINPDEEKGFDPEVLTSVALTLAGALAGL